TADPEGLDRAGMPFWLAAVTQTPRSRTVRDPKLICPLDQTHKFQPGRRPLRTDSPERLPSTTEPRSRCDQRSVTNLHQLRIAFRRRCFRPYRYWCRTQIPQRTPRLRRLAASHPLWVRQTVL